MKLMFPSIGDSVKSVPVKNEKNRNIFIARPQPFRIITSMIAVATKIIMKIWITFVVSCGSSTTGASFCSSPYGG